MNRQAISPEGLRVDGRRANELRVMSAELGLFKDADGSACVKQGNTTILASVFGPREPTNRANILMDRASIKVTFQTAFQQSNRDKKSIDTANTIAEIYKTLIITSLYPRSEIDIYIQVLQLDGGVLHAAINATTLALIDAGIPMIDILSACSAGNAPKESILDMNYIEESNEIPIITVACLKQSKKIALLEMNGKMTMEEVGAVSESAIQGCCQVAEQMETWIRDTTNSRANTSAQM